MAILEPLSPHLNQMRDYIAFLPSLEAPLTKHHDADQLREARSVPSCVNFQTSLCSHDSSCLYQTSHYADFHACIGRPQGQGIRSQGQRRPLLPPVLLPRRNIAAIRPYHLANKSAKRVAGASPAAQKASARGGFAMRPKTGNASAAPPEAQCSVGGNLRPRVQ